MVSKKMVVLLLVGMVLRSTEKTPGTVSFIACPHARLGGEDPMFAPASAAFIVSYFS